MTSGRTQGWSRRDIRVATLPQFEVVRYNDVQTEARGTLAGRTPLKAKPIASLVTEEEHHVVLTNPTPLPN